jgi:hypothetical protein
MSRHSLVKDILNNIENGVFVEIGTDRGDFADFILENSKNSILYCIDPYISFNEYEDAINNVTGDQLYNSTYNKLKTKYQNRIIFIRKFSEQAVNDIPNDIDFLYIDGNHKYNYVYKDLELYFPKVKKNGIIVGDDAVDTDELNRNQNGDVHIQWAINCYGSYGVIKAFNDFCQNNKLKGEIIYNQYVVRK